MSPPPRPPELASQTSLAPLALVGMACRFPGGASGVEAYWRLLVEGRDAVVEVPPERWSWERFYDPDPAAPGKTQVREAGFLQESLEDFDAPFFGLPPRMARTLDPQQRLLLETTWRACEDAGIDPERLQGSRTAVFVGSFSPDNLLQQLNVLSRGEINQHTAANVTSTMTANRISHAFDLRGPSVAIDTACSGSLVAVHLAAQSLWRGECELALVGGVNAMLRPELTIAMSKGGFLSPDGRCKAFDASANGYGRGEGAGVVLLKPLAAAEAAGDRIYALLRATGSNQDGRTLGISLPNPEAQQALLREVYAAAGVDRARVGYVEAHGTGTAAGDPIEAEALGAVLGRGRETPLLIGSVKTNIGHLEGAAGIAGFMKAALCLHHRQVPPNLHFESPNPAIDFEGLGLRVPTELLPLAGARPVVGVNSFGYGGTNAHVVLEAVEAAAPAAPSAAVDPALLLVSARSPESFRRFAGALADELEAGRDPSALGRALATRRTQHPFRRALQLHPERGSALAELRALATAPQDPPRASSEGRLAFVYTGMGSQSWGMAADLYAEEPVFRAAVDACDAAFAPHLRGSPGVADLFRSLSPGKERGGAISAPRWAQPANLALQVGLTELWRSLGVTPELVLGHSVGEIGAAWASGSLSLAEAARITSIRCQLQQELADRSGAMAAVALSADEARALLELYADRVVVAAINGPRAVTIAGERAAVEELGALLEDQGVFQRVLPVDVAYHAPQMDALRERFLAELGEVEWSVGQIPLVSSVAPGLRPEGQRASYWWRNVREPVEFCAGVEALLERGARTFLEVGPHPVLGASLRDQAQASGRQVTCLPSLRRGTPGGRSLRQSLAQLYQAGAPVDWSAPWSAAPHAAFPPYPWNRQRLWSETHASLADKHGTSAHPFLQRELPTPEPSFEAELTAALRDELADHQVGGRAVFPGAAILEAALALADALEAPLVLDRVEFLRALEIAPGVRLRIEARGRAWTLHASDGGPRWRLHAQGKLVEKGLPPRRAQVDLAELREPLREREREDFYAQLSARGLDYGPGYQALQRVWAGKDQVLARLALPEPQAQYRVPPALLDGGFQALLALLQPGFGQVLPVSVRQLRVYAPLPPSVWAQGSLRAVHAHAMEADLTLCDEGGAVLLEAFGVRVAELSSSPSLPESLAWSWETRSAPERSPLPRRWLVLGGGERAASLARSLEAAGCVPNLADAPSGPEGLRALLQETQAEGLALLAALDAAPADPLVAASLLPLAGVGDRALRVVLFTRGGASVEGFRELPVNPGHSALIAMARVLAAEHAQLDLVRVDLDPAAPLALEAELLQVSGDEVAVRGGRLYSPALSPLAQPPARLESADEPFRLRLGRPGLIDSLRWEPDRRVPPGRGEVEIQVESTALNFKDYLKVMDLLPAHYLDGTFFAEHLGLEASGRIVAVGAGVEGYALGDPVLTADARNAFCSYVTVPTRFLFPRPSPLSANEAPILINYVTAHHSLAHLARVQEGETILIHSAAGGVGLAAIRVAQHLGARVIATAGSAPKRRWLEEQGIEGVLDSRDLAFVDQVLARTEGRGVDVVLNSLAGEGYLRSFECLSAFGRFVEIGRPDAGVPAGVLRRNASYQLLDVDVMMKERPELFRRIATEVHQLLESGALPPLPVTAFPAAEVVEAFRTLGRARHIGKIVVELGPVEVSERSSRRLEGEGTYLVTGGTGGLGLELARWLAQRGARRLVLVSRSGGATPESHHVLRGLRACGVQVEARSLDVSDPAQLDALFADLAQGPPLRGVIHGAMVLQDGVLAGVEPADLERVLAPKARGAWLLHERTRELELEFFVLLSSISTLVGNRGQGSYAAANGFLDGLAWHRRQLGLPALTLNLGAVGGVGVVARDPRLQLALRQQGIEPVTPAQVGAALEELLAAGATQATLAQVNWPLWATQNPAPARSSRFAGLVGPARDAAGPAVEGSLMDWFLEQLGKVLLLPRDRISPEQSLDELGLDSLLALEVVNVVRERYGVTLSPSSLTGRPIRALVEEVRAARS